MSNSPLRILMVGCGNMGRSHALACQRLEAFELCGLVSTGSSKQVLGKQLNDNLPLFDDLSQALVATSPDAVCIATWPDSHEAYALMALEAGCHLFIEKPLAATLEGARRVVDAARKAERKLVVGYILRHHPAWQRFVTLSHSLGKPLVMRMNLNQQSHGNMWHVHQQIMQSLSPIVDCGVHYLDVMCQMTQAKPVSVSAIGARLSDVLPDGQYNYGQLQVRFDDGSVGWYEAGWGPMMSQTAFFVKDVIGPHGSLSIVARQAGGEGESDNVDSHTRTESLRLHHAELDDSQQFVHKDEWFDYQDEPDHLALCQREQTFFASAIRHNLDLATHQQLAIDSLAIVLAADKAVRQQRTIFLAEEMP
ncbi:oxidoreductase [[Pantoea] beijingensis]|uniref:Oxidoreductase n=1 Tax=[Pantoea] beijingensis TaxID=1324864 RepID=A0A443IEL6_9GAMM|nr:Gfo/Idh/MocA family oxidoreductase [[Pantoea] beijingensis]RWR02490.1 oxidoreductase [[Pantoea] beijingensis]